MLTLKKGQKVIDKFQKPTVDEGVIVKVTKTEVEIDWKQPTYKIRTIPRKQAEHLLVNAPEEK